VLNTYPLASNSNRLVFSLEVKFIKDAKKDVHSTNYDQEAEQPKRAFFQSAHQHYPFLTTHSPHGGKTNTNTFATKTHHQLNSFESPKP